MEPLVPPPKELCFNVRLPADTSVDMLITGLIDVAGSGQVDTVQHRGGMFFMCSVKTHAALERILRQQGIKVDNQLVAIELLGPRTVNVACYMLPVFVHHDDLRNALSKYGKVHSVTAVKYKDAGEKGTIHTGTRIVKMEMNDSLPVPNYVRVRGYLVTCDYPGVKRVCRRCKQEGHIRVDCTTAFCDRCSLFGHDSRDCALKCRRCKGDHATVDCTRSRSYAAVATHADSSDFPELPPARENVVGHLQLRDADTSSDDGSERDEARSHPARTLHESTRIGCEPTLTSGSEESAPNQEQRDVTASASLSQTIHAVPPISSPGTTSESTSVATCSPPAVVSSLESSASDSASSPGGHSGSTHTLPQRLAPSALLATQRGPVRRRAAVTAGSILPAQGQPSDQDSSEGMELDRSENKRAISSSSGADSPGLSDVQGLGSAAIKKPKTDPVSDVALEHGS